MKKILCLVAGVFTFFGATIALAEGELEVDHFIVELGAERIKLGEAVDITIKAVDINENVVPSYDGSVMVFSDTNPDAIFPDVLIEQSYTFKASDAGEIKFENAIKYTELGIQDLMVFDENNDELFGKAEIEIVSEDVVGMKVITILNPENATIIATSDVQVTGTTEKNHKVIIVINDTKKLETTSDDTGSFTVNATGLVDGENTFVAMLYNADNEEIGTSLKVMITSRNTAPVFDSITVTPKDDVAPQTQVTIEVLATPDLESVSVILNDAIIKLEEKEQSGLYTALTNAPAKDGEYFLSVSLKDELGHITDKSGVEVLTVKTPEVQKVEGNDGENDGEDVIEPETDLNSAKLRITGLKLTKFQNHSILSWDEISVAESYNIYKTDKATGEQKLIENVKEPQTTIYITGDKITYDDFYVTAIGKLEEDKTGEITDLSDMTKVQTGPAEIIFLLLLSMFIGYMIIRRNKNA